VASNSEEQALAGRLGTAETRQSADARSIRDLSERLATAETQLKALQRLTLTAAPSTDPAVGGYKMLVSGTDLAPGATVFWDYTDWSGAVAQLRNVELGKVGSDGTFSMTLQEPCLITENSVEAFDGGNTYWDVSNIVPLGPGCTQSSSAGQRPASTRVGPVVRRRCRSCPAARLRRARASSRLLSCCTCPHPPSSSPR
jgi:hypothetical protein